MPNQLTHEEVYDIIDGERWYQDSFLGNARREGQFEGTPLTPGEILCCMQKILNDTRDEWYKPGGTVGAQDGVRKIAALAVQYMERYGAKPRLPSLPE
jgi:hypothetical protein